jgi:hypothetical protein
MAKEAARGVIDKRRLDGVWLKIHGTDTLKKSGSWDVHVGAAAASAAILILQTKWRIWSTEFACSEVRISARLSRISLHANSFVIRSLQ